MSDPEFDWHANALLLANGVAGTLDEETRGHAGMAARYIVAGLRRVCDSNDEVAMKVAMTISKMMAVLLETEFQFTADHVHNSMLAYSMAAGALEGGYDLPLCPKCSGEEPDADVPDFVPPEWGSGL